jgi:hypothetical protein
VERQADFAKRSEHLMAVIGKQLVKQFHGKEPEYSCGNGRGRCARIHRLRGGMARVRLMMPRVSRVRRRGRSRPVSPAQEDSTRDSR